MGDVIATMFKFIFGFVFVALVGWALVIGLSFLLCTCTERGVNIGYMATHPGEQTTSEQPIDSK